MKKPLFQYDGRNFYLGDKIIIEKNDQPVEGVIVDFRNDYSFPNTPAHPHDIVRIKKTNGESEGYYCYRIRAQKGKDYISQQLVQMHGAK